MGSRGRVRWGLLGGLIVLLGLLVSAVYFPGGLLSTIEPIANSDAAARMRALTEKPAEPKYEMVEMVVDRVGISRINLQPVVILKEKDGELELPIWIGYLEADAISVVLEGYRVSRPLTSDLLNTVISQSGATLNYILISDLQEEVFYAIIYLNVNWKALKIDARPSDAIALALRAGAPIYVSKTVLAKAGTLPESEIGEYILFRGNYKILFPSETSLSG